MILKFFVDRFSKNVQIQNLMKIGYWDPGCFVWTDEDMKVTVACRNFANAPKNWYGCSSDCFIFF